MEGGEEQESRNEVKNGEPTGHIITFRRNDLFANETNTMGDELFLAARKAFYSRIGAGTIPP